MKIFIEVFCVILRYSGLFFLLRQFFIKKKVTVVVYHDPKYEIFEKHIKYLSKRYNFISFDDLIEGILKKDWSNIPVNSLVITFDDGHKGNYQLLPIFKKYSIKPIIYCCSGIIGTNRSFWWKTINPMLTNEYKCLNQNDRLNRLEKDVGFYNEREYSKRQALTIEEINEIEKEADIGSHTIFHPILTCCTNFEKKKEIVGSKKQLEMVNHNFNCKHISYPNGDYDEETIDIAKEAGYISGRTIDVGWNDINSDPFKIKITGISDDASINKVAAQLTGVTMFLRYLVKGSLKGLYK